MRTIIETMEQAGYKPMQTCNLMYKSDTLKVEIIDHSVYLRDSSNEACETITPIEALNRIMADISIRLG